MLRRLYPFLLEKHRSALDVSAISQALLILLLALGVVYLTFRNRINNAIGYVPLSLGASASPDVQETPTNLMLVVEIATATPNPQVTPLIVPTEYVGQELASGYTKVTVLGRFSNYFPALSGINCAADCELLADGTRTDTAVNEGFKVVACPQELLLGTRIEYPPDSGLVWTCRDRGGEINFYYSENGTPIYWFDFLSPVAWVDYGSYIQVQVWVPEGVQLP